MTYQTISSADYLDREEREEQRFLRAMKGVLRDEIARLQDDQGLTQFEIADRLGYDPGQLSKILSPDRHNSTSSIFRVLFRLGKRWTFGAVSLPGSNGNQQGQISGARPEIKIDPAPAARSLRSGDDLIRIPVEQS